MRTRRAAAPQARGERLWTVYKKIVRWYFIAMMWMALFEFARGATVGAMDILGWAVVFRLFEKWWISELSD